MSKKSSQSSFDDSTLEAISGELLSPGEHGERRKRLAMMREAATNSEITIPVLGLQGSGKSTFLNALLMPDVVLPVDARETNCVPVEIRYGESVSMKVFFHDAGCPPRDIGSHGEFEEYISEVYNESNKKGVAYGLVTVNNPLLADNVVFVDLPGVGSMTSANVGVTMRYIQKTVSGIFMLNTYRPITRLEKTFLREAMTYVSKYWFVQNRWASESDADVKETVKHNRITIGNVVKDVNSRGDYDPTIFVINCKHALDAMLTNDDKMREETGIVPFAREMSLFCKGWRQWLMNGFDAECLEYVLLLLAKAGELLSDVNKDEAGLRKEMAEKEEETRRMIERNDLRIDDAKTFCDDTALELRKWLNKNANDAIGNIRARMREVIGGGLVDGPELQQAFQGTQEKYFEDLYLDLSDKVSVLVQKLTNRIDQLEILTDAGSVHNFAAFKKQKAFKWEKGLSPTFGVAGSAIGFQLTTALVSAAAKGTIAGFWGGPIGVAVGIGAALAIAGIGWWLHRTKQSQRKQVTIRQLEQPLMEAKTVLEDSVTRYMNDVLGGIRLKLEDFKKAEVNSYELERNEHSERIAKRILNLKDSQDKYESYCSYLKEWKG
jgi:hypothetical protein